MCLFEFEMPQEPEEAKLDAGRPLAERMRAERLEQIRETVRACNAVIKAEAEAHGATLVDIHALFNELAEKGLVVNGKKLTTDFLGGLFSLDGIHPTNTGYAVVANKFIRTMNRSLGTGIPPVSVEQVFKSDPLQ